MIFFLIVIVLVSLESSDAFGSAGRNVSPMTRIITVPRCQRPFLRMSEEENEDTSYDSATTNIQKEKESEYDNMYDDDDEEILSYNMKKDELEDVKKRVRSRAAKMEINESIVTAQAIAIAETKARNKEEWDYDDITRGLGTEDETLTEIDFPTKRPPLPILDQVIIAFMDTMGLKSDTGELFDPWELNELDEAEIENIDRTPFFERAKYVWDIAKPPSWNTANNLFSLMWVIFLSALIAQTWLDYELHEWYVRLGFFPAPDTISYENFSGMEAPEGFTLGMTPEELAEFAARP